MWGVMKSYSYFCMGIIKKESYVAKKYKQMAEKGQSILPL